MMMLNLTTTFNQTTNASSKLLNDSFKNRPLSSRNAEIFFGIIITQVIIVVLVNSIFLYAVISVKRACYRASDVFMMGLFISYIIYNLAFVTFFKNAQGETIESLFTRIMGILFDFWFFSSLTFVILLSVDRYIAIKQPFFYDTLTWRYTIYSISFGLLLPLAYTLYIQFFEYHILSVDIPILFLFITLTTSNYYVYCEAKRQLATIAVNTVGDKDEHQLRSLRKQRWRSLKICFSMVASTFVLRLPHSTLNIFSTYAPHLFTGNRNTMQWIFYTTVFIENTNAIVDPLLYGCFNHDIRRTLRLKFNTVEHFLERLHCFKYFMKRNRSATNRSSFLSELQTFV